MTNDTRLQSIADRGTVARFGKPKPKGHLPLDLFGLHAVLAGGPYMHRPEDMAGVKMAAEIARPYDVSIPTEDYSVPDPRVLRRGMIETVNLLLDGRQVYVGCMGGIGRTGLFMAAMAKLAGEADPVRYVRHHYLSHAVETPQQRAFIDILPVEDLQFRIKTTMFWRSLLWWAPALRPKVSTKGL